MIAPALLAADANSGVYYQLARLQSLSEWWQWLLLIGVIAAIVSYVVWMYRKDSVELTTALAILLGGLRLFALLGILLFFFQLEKRTQKTIVKNSRALLLVDTSQSMGLRDADSTSVPAMPSRLEQVVLELKSGQLLPELRKQHDVVVYRFDAAESPVEVASLPKLPSEQAGAENQTPQQELLASLAGARKLALIAAGILAVAVLAGVIYLIWGRATTAQSLAQRKAGAEQNAYSLLVSVVCLIIAAVVFGTANLLHPDISIGAILGLSEPKVSSPTQGTEKQAELPPIDWANQLLPRGVETRLGDNLKALVDKERGGPIAAIVVFSDGGQNAGLDVSVASTVAADSLISVHGIGLGSDKRPANIRVVDLEAPEKVFPGDKFTISGYVQGVGLNQTALTAELVSTDVEGKGEQVEDQQTIDIGKAGQIIPVKFELKPEEEGVRLFKLRVAPQTGEIEKRDNEKTAKVEIVDRKTKVLLIAGGPTRDFIFLRNQLFRDKESTVHVLLQSARPGISQDAHEILTSFPTDPDELFEYDAIVAFDPDWEAFDDKQVQLLEDFVAEKGGGLIVVAGPVFTPQWSSRRRGDPRIDTIKNLYPISFYFQGSATLSLGRFGSDKAWPLNFSREGEEAEFLWIDETAEANKRAWDDFAGVYGYYAIKDPKPGARVYARFSDPDTALDNELPVYFAGHFYGSGRVFFMASGELWRVRAENDVYFETFYTRLLRWVSEGRRLRDSSRGVLLTDKDRALLGDPIAIRAVLQDAQFKPLQAEQVAATIIQPDSTRIPITLRKTKDADRQGTFTEQFIALQEGDYQIQLQHPAAADSLLVRDVRVRMPALETEKPERNDKVLREMTDRTGGQYFVGLDAALQSKSAGTKSLVELIKPQDQRNVLPGTPDRTFDRVLMTWLMGLICGALCLEWLFRRLSKLA
ncbi:hypothetical protein ETAA8_31710 [Anatilimnocola aggregata]|uniref:VWFA domain-containing protein n=1 Tax=Anatilimnocola aggregata TaxID=2528021 RepID=A0A517YCY5_9BACT|nr:hypothetical protein [Anatilimnocola aggregata]QDU28078.1 hypothetical protein ETAA8_31710 [Anatilimnocola aggregata]